MRRRQFKYKQPHYIIPSLISISCETFRIAYISWTTQYELLNVVIFFSLFLHNWLVVCTPWMQMFPYEILGAKKKSKKKLWPATTSRRHINIFPLWILFSLFCVRCAFIFNICIRLIQQCFFFFLGEPVIFVTNSTCVTGVHLTSCDWLH